jgi:DNA-binding NtrC family response regulator
MSDPERITQILRSNPLAPRGAGLWLVVEVPWQPDRWVELGEQPLVVGSAADCGLRLDDPHVSSRHAELARVAGGVVLRDLGSSNGTRVADMAVKEVVLTSGVPIVMGTTRLRFEITSGSGGAGDTGRLVRDPVGDDELRDVPPRFGGAVGTGPAMRRLFALLARIAPTDLTVTLIGETGTGKDVLAHAIHDVSPRRAGPFVVFDCAAVPPSLIESELFGHEKGAFTGAVAARAGVFERAHGGTLFIDEIGELPLELQPKLLRALEQRQVQRLGGASPQAVDVRIVAATNRDLAARVEAGAFRQDLFFRLSTAVLHVPPLRERLEDLPELIAHFLAQTGRTLAVTPAALAQLRAHAWPGNVRELKNAIASGAALATGGALDVKDLVFLRPGGTVTPRLPTERAGSGKIPAPPGPPGGSLQAQERLAIQRALKDHGGNRTHAARALGIAVSTLYTKLKKYGIGGDEP